MKKKPCPSLHLTKTGSTLPKLKIPPAYVPDLWICNHNHSRRTLSDDRDDKLTSSNIHFETPSICGNQNHNGYHQSLFSSWSSQVQNETKNLTKPLENIKKYPLFKKSLVRKRSHSYDNKLIDNYKYLLDLKKDFDKNQNTKSKLTKRVKVSKNRKNLLQSKRILPSIEPANNAKVEINKMELDENIENLILNQVPQNFVKYEEIFDKQNINNDYVLIQSSNTSLKSSHSNKIHNTVDIFTERHYNAKKIVKSARETSINISPEKAYFTTNSKISQSEPVLNESLKVLRPCLFINEIKDSFLNKNFDNLIQSQIGIDSKAKSKKSLNTSFNNSFNENKKIFENNEKFIDDRSNDAINKMKDALSECSSEIKNKTTRDKFEYDNSTEINSDKEPLKCSENDLSNVWISSGKSKLSLKFERVLRNYERLSTQKKCLILIIILLLFFLMFAIIVALILLLKGNMSTIIYVPIYNQSYFDHIHLKNSTAYQHGYTNITALTNTKNNTENVKITSTVSNFKNSSNTTRHNTFTTESPTTKIEMSLNISGTLTTKINKPLVSVMSFSTSDPLITTTMRLGKVGDLCNLKINNCGKYMECKQANLNLSFSYCQCKDGYVSDTSRFCSNSGLFNASCDTQNDCSKHTNCINNKCICKNGYHPRKDRTCFGKYNSTCESDEDCLKNGECATLESGDKRCKCTKKEKSLYVPKNDFHKQCLLLIGAKCNASNECVENSRCDKYCSCRQSNVYFPNESHQCVDGCANVGFFKFSNGTAIKFPHPTKCGMYYTCDPREIEICTSGYIFNVKTQSCDSSTFCRS